MRGCHLPQSQLSQGEIGACKEIQVSLVSALRTVLPPVAPSLRSPWHSLPRPWFEGFPVPIGLLRPLLHQAKFSVTKAQCKWHLLCEAALSTIPVSTALFLPPSPCQSSCPVCGMVELLIQSCLPPLLERASTVAGNMLTPESSCLELNPVFKRDSIHEREIALRASGLPFQVGLASKSRTGPKPRQ